MFRQIIRKAGILLVVVLLGLQGFSGTTVLGGYLQDAVVTEAVPAADAEEAAEERPDSEETTDEEESGAEETTDEVSADPEEVAEETTEEETTSNEEVKEAEETDTRDPEETGGQNYETEKGLIVMPETRPLVEKLMRKEGAALLEAAPAAGSANGVSGIKLQWEIYNTGMDAWWPSSNGSVTRDANWSYFTTERISDFRPGDVIVWDYNGMWVGHIAIITEVAGDGSYYYTADGNAGGSTGISLIRRTNTYRSGASSNKVLIWRNREHGPAIAASAYKYASRIIENFDMTLKNRYGSVNWCYAFVVEALLQTEAGYLQVNKEKADGLSVAGAVYRVYEKDKRSVAGWFVMTGNGAGRVVERISAESVKSFEDVTAEYTSKTGRGKMGENIVTASKTYSFGRANPSETYWYCSTGKDTMELAADSDYYIQEYLEPANRKYLLDDTFYPAHTAASKQAGGNPVTVTLKDEVAEEEPGYLQLTKETVNGLPVAGAVYNVFKKDKTTLAGRFILTAGGQGRVVKRLTKDQVTSYDDATSDYAVDSEAGKFARNLVADGHTYSFGRSTPGGAVWYVSTGSSSLELEKGTYYVKEFLTPVSQKYGLNEEFYKVTVASGQTAAAACKDEVAGGIRLTKVSVPEEAGEMYSLKGALYHLFKNYEDGNYSGYAGYSFIIGDSSGTGYVAHKTTDEQEAKKHAYYVDRGSAFYYTDWKEKEITIDNEETFYVQEAAAPASGKYELTQPVNRKVTAKPGETVTVYASDPVKKGRVSLIKTSSPLSASAKEGYDLKGALYNLYLHEDHTGYTGVSFITDEKGIGYKAERTDDPAKIPEKAFVRTANSSTKTYYFWTLFQETEAEMDYGTYYVRERLAPLNGHYTIGEVDEAVTVQPDATAKIKGSDHLIYMDRIRVLLQKADADSLQTETGGKGDGPQGDGSFERAEFTVRYYDTVFTKKSAAPAKAVRTWVFKTNGKGQLVFSDPESLVSGDELYYDQDQKPAVPQGTLLIEETKAPQGYLKNQEPQIMTIEMDGQTRKRAFYKEDGSPSGTQEIANVSQAADTEICIAQTPVSGGVKIAKRDAETGFAKGLGEASLEGAELSVYNLSTCPVYTASGQPVPGAESAEKATEENCVCRLVTAADGTAQTDVHALPYGTYLVKETKAPEGYLLNETWQEIFEVRTDGKFIDLTGSPVLDPVERGHVTFTKLVKGPDGKAPYANILWEITAVQTGETHYALTGKDGVFDSALSEKNNANDKAVRKGEDGTLEIDETLLDAENGVWFSGYKPASADGNDVEEASSPDTGLASFVYGTYLFREIETGANKGGSLVSFMVEISDIRTNLDGDPRGLVDAGQIEDSQPPQKLYADPQMTQDTPVYPGKEIGYRLYWSNTTDAEQILTVYDTLSEGLSYQEGSASLKPSLVTENEDGTTFLLWELGTREPADCGVITYRTIVNEKALVECRVQNEYELQYGNNPKQTIGTLVNPLPHYTISKRRVPDAPAKRNGSGFGFFAGDEVTYEVAVTNDGQTPLSLDVTDAFHKDAKAAFKDLKITRVEGGGNPAIVEGTGASVHLDPGETALVTYRAKVTQKAKEYLASASADDKNASDDGYVNTAKTFHVTAEYEDAQGKKRKLTGKDTELLADKEDSANTPVQVPEKEVTRPEETTAPEKTTVPKQTTTGRQKTTRTPGSVKTGDDTDTAGWILLAFAASVLIAFSVRMVRKRMR